MYHTRSQPVLDQISTTKQFMVAPHPPPSTAVNIYVLFSTSLSLTGNLADLAATAVLPIPTVCVQTIVWLIVFGILMCTKMLMHVTAQRGCMKTARGPALGGKSLGALGGKSLATLGGKSKIPSCTGRTHPPLKGGKFPAVLEENLLHREENPLLHWEENPLLHCEVERKSGFLVPHCTN